MTKTVTCSWCKKDFQPTAANQKYCHDCRTKHGKEIKAYYEATRIRKRRVLKVKPLPKKTIPDIVRDIMAYNKKHGTHLTYGQYVGKLQMGTLKD